MYDRSTSILDVVDCCQTFAPLYSSLKIEEKRTAAFQLMQNCSDSVYTLATTVTVVSQLLKKLMAEDGHDVGPLGIKIPGVKGMFTLSPSRYTTVETSFSALPSSMVAACHYQGTATFLIFSFTFTKLKHKQRGEQRAQ